MSNTRKLARAENAASVREATTVLKHGRDLSLPEPCGCTWCHRDLAKLNRSPRWWSIASLPSSWTLSVDARTALQPGTGTSWNADLPGPFGESSPRGSTTGSADADRQSSEVEGPISTLHQNVLQHRCEGRGAGGYPSYSPAAITSNIHSGTTRDGGK